MGRPKGSKTKPQLNTNNIIKSGDKENDENENPRSAKEPPGRLKTAIGTRGANKNKSNQIYLDLVGPPIAFFPKTKLPQNKVVLQRYLHLREQYPTEKQHMLVNIMYKEVVTELWKPARIFTRTERECKKIIDKLVKDFTDFKNYAYKGSQDSPKNIDAFKPFLVKLCDLAPHNLKELLIGTNRLNTLWEDDWQFYQNMCQAKQVGCVAGRDVKLAVKESGKEKRLATEETKKVKGKAQKKKREEVVTGEAFDDGKQARQEEDGKDPDIVVNIRKKRSKVHIEIDPVKIVEQTSGTFDRLGLSARQSAMVLASVVKAGGGDLAQVQLSKSAVLRKGRKPELSRGRRSCTHLSPLTNIFFTMTQNL